jgi:outer membrane protein OmpA-like peptidoglycan-associated protein
MPQHTEFMNGTYNYPAKPRNQWEIGIKGGAFGVSGDVPAKFPTFGGGIHVRKALGYLISLRLEYVYGTAKGQAWQASQNFGKNTAWTSTGYVPHTVTATGDRIQGERIFYNFKTVVQDLALEGIITLNNIRFHKAKTGVAIYALGGLGGMIYDTKVNALNGSTKYNFSGVPDAVYEERKDVKDQLEDDILDDSYETDAETEAGNRRPKLFGQTFRPVGHVGAGIAFKINNRWNIALENRFTVTKDDLIDGQRWQEQAHGDAVLTQDHDAYNFLSLGVNVNLGSKSVEPLWWMNPLDYAYSEIRNPRLMRLPKPVLPDSDGDGVTDQFDLEQTPPGTPVDVHGVSRDTDGDGVPDARDKELVTPTVCQPVDADGVGKCPCPEDCGPRMDTSCVNALGALPSVTFSGNSVAISDDARSLLASVAARMRNNPECRVVVTGYCASNKSEQQRSWDRVNAVINYMVEREGISADRFVFLYAQEGGDCNTVDMRAATAEDQGPNTVPAPHPNLRRGK